MAFHIVSFASGAAPEWWAARGIFTPGQATDDYAVVNVGQLKNVAKKAMQELNTKLAYAGGAGATITTAVTNFSATNGSRDDFAVVNIGQLKAVAKPYYDRLNALSYSVTVPWATGGDDYAVANIGQLKRVFSFAVPVTVTERLAARDFPSVFQAWGEAQNIVPTEDPVITRARHDVYFDGVGQLGLEWNDHYIGQATDFTSASLAIGETKRTELRMKNPKMVVLFEIRYKNGPLNEAVGAWTWLPPTHQWWKKDASGNPLVDPEDSDYRLLDYGNSGLRAQIAAQALKAIQSGVFDGVMLDWWFDDSNVERQQLVAAIRSAIGPDALIMVNSNQNQPNNTKAYVNGLFMETTVLDTAAQWANVMNTLVWAETNLQSPRINCVETWDPSKLGTSTARNAPDALRRMRAITTLSLTKSSGCCLFSDHNDVAGQDHLHDWYNFWNRLPSSLGKAVGAATLETGNVWVREFTNGWVAHNSTGSGDKIITLPAPAISRKNGGVATTIHTVSNFDGDIFIK